MILAKSGEFWFFHPARCSFAYRGIAYARREFETGGTLNVLWLGTHVSRLRETTGEVVPKRWYDPLGKNP